MDEKEYYLNRAKNSEKYRIGKFYHAVKDGRIKVDEAIKEIIKVKPTLKFPGSLPYYDEIMNKLIGLKNG